MSEEEYEDLIEQYSNVVDELHKTINDKDWEIDQLKQQLDEKDKEIKKLNWQLKDKDFIIKNLNHSLSVAPNANAGQRARIDELTKIVKEKDKEIKVRNDKLGKLKKQLTDCLNSLKRKTQSNRDLQSIRYKANRQFAIQELEKVKDWLNEPFDEGGCFKNGGDLIGFIDQQIKELKGEKDVED